jgi:hypothetical protein
VPKKVRSMTRDETRSHPSPSTDSIDPLMIWDYIEHQKLINRSVEYRPAGPVRRVYQLLKVSTSEIVSKTKSNE